MVSQSTPFAPLGGKAQSCETVAADAAHYIGWEDSPFQLEGEPRVRRRRLLRRVRKLRPPPLGDRAPASSCSARRAGHIYQMITAHNFAPGIAGVIF
jgi:hypothetical protein